MTVSELQAAFDADEKAWTGKKVKVQGVYFSMTTSSSGGKKAYTVSVANSKDDTTKTMACNLATEPPLLHQYTPILVEGSIRKMFGAAIDDCTMVQK